MSAVERVLIRALLARAGGDGALLRADAAPWASLTFEGHRRTIELAVPEAAVAAFETGLAELDLPLPGHVLADLAIEGRAGQSDGTCHLCVAALTLVAT